MKCKDCKHFDKKFIPPKDLDLPTYGECKRHGKIYYLSELDNCLFKGYYWRQLKGKLTQAKRYLLHYWRRIIRFLRWKIYYKVEHLWIRPQLCCVCGERKGKYYYGSHKFPVEGQGKYITIDEHSHTVRWVGKKKKIPHWECEECFTRINSGKIISPDETQVGYGIAGV